MAGRQGVRRRCCRVRYQASADLYCCRHAVKADSLRARGAHAEYPVQEPFAVVDAVTVIAIDPHGFAARVFGDEVIAAHVGAIPPPGFDPLGSVAQHPGLRFEQMAERLGLGSSQTGRGKAGSTEPGAVLPLSRGRPALISPLSRHARSGRYSACGATSVTASSPRRARSRSMSGTDRNDVIAGKQAEIAARERGGRQTS